MKYAGYFELGAKTDENKKLTELENRMLEILSQAKSISPEDLSGAKANLIMQKHTYLDSNEGYMHFLMSAVYAEGWQSLNNYSDLINTVSINDIKRVVDTYFSPQSKSVLVVKNSTVD